MEDGSRARRGDSGPPMTADIRIVRLWRAEALPDRIPDYLEHFEAQVAPRLLGTRGFLGARIVQRGVSAGVELLVATFWESIEALRAFTGDDVSSAVVHPTARAALLRVDDRAMNYEVVRTLTVPTPP